MDAEPKIVKSLRETGIHIECTMNALITHNRCGAVILIIILWRYSLCLMKGKHYSDKHLFPSHDSPALKTLRRLLPWYSSSPDRWSGVIVQHVERTRRGRIHRRATSSATITPLVMAGRMAHAKPHIQKQKLVMEVKSMAWMDGWSHVTHTAKVNSCFFFGSLTPKSTLAGEIWMDQLTTPATFVSVWAKFWQRLRLFWPMRITTLYSIWYGLISLQPGSILPPLGLWDANAAQLTCREQELYKPNSERGFWHNRFNRIQSQRGSHLALGCFFWRAFILKHIQIGRYVLFFFPFFCFFVVCGILWVWPLPEHKFAKWKRGNIGTDWIRNLEPSRHLQFASQWQFGAQEHYILNKKKQQLF